MFTRSLLKTWDNHNLLQCPLVPRKSIFLPTIGEVSEVESKASQTQDDTYILDDDTQVKVAPFQVVGKCNHGHKQFGPPTQEAPNVSTLLEVVTQTPISSTQVPSIPINLTPSLIQPQQVTQQHVVGNKLVFPLILLCHVCLS